MRTHCSGVLPGPVDRLGHALAQCAVVVDQRVADVGERQPAQLGDGVVGAALAAADVVDQLPHVGLVHDSHATVGDSLDWTTLAVHACAVA